MKLFPLLVLMVSNVATAQVASSNISNESYYNESGDFLPRDYSSFSSKRKLYQRNTGMIIGLQKGKSTLIELGGEAHWRKIGLRKSYIVGATANMEYDFKNNVIGYKAGIWMKRGKVNLTYGANVSYFTNFNSGNRFGIGPSIGFRLLGLHLVNGYNFLTKDKTNGDETPLQVNPLYISLRYYFPVSNTFTWDRKTMKKKRERKKERLNRKEERQKKRESADHKTLWDIFKTKKKAS